MNTLFALLTGFVAALFYSRGKADPVRAFHHDLKRCCRWLKATWEGRKDWKKDQDDK